MKLAVEVFQRVLAFGFSGTAHGTTLRCWCHGQMIRVPFRQTRKTGRFCASMTTQAGQAAWDSLHRFHRMEEDGEIRGAARVSLICREDRQSGRMHGEIDK